MADEICVFNGTPSNGQANEEMSDKEESNGDEEKEYEAIDLELDQLNSCLDKLENWNDSLQSRLKDLLVNMQQTRKDGQQLQDQSNQESGENFKQD